MEPLWSEIMKKFLGYLGLALVLLSIVGIVVPGQHWHTFSSLFVLLGMPMALIVIFVAIKSAAKRPEYGDKRGSMKIVLPILLQSIPALMLTLLLHSLVAWLVRK